MIAKHANRILLLAWTRGACAAMASTLELGTPGIRDALHLCERWLPRRRDSGDPLPHFLPDGSPVPEAATPWPRSDSPLPGVDLEVDAVVDLAANALVGSVTSPDDGLGATNRLVTLLRPERLDFELARRLAARWVSKGHALACLRAGLPAGVPAGWLEEDEVRTVLADLKAIRTDRHAGPRALRRFVLRGADPLATWRAMARWSPHLGLLPTGQPLTVDGTPQAAGREIGAYWVPRDVEQRARTLAQLGVERGAAELVGTLGIPRSEAGLLLRALLGERDPRPPSAARRAFDDAVEQTLLVAPYHWAVLAMANVREDAGVETMAVGATVGGRLFLFFNPTFVTSISPEERVGVLIHEIDHVILDHLRPPPRKRGEAARPADAHAWMLATECTANEFVPYPLPGEPITIERLGLSPGKSTEARYRALRSRKRPLPQSSGCAISRALVAEPHTANDVVPTPRPSLGPVLAAAADAIPEELREGALASLGRHGVGQLPAGLLERLEGRRAAKVAWRAALRGLAGRLAARVTTRTYPSRRAPERVGVVPGRRTRRRPPCLLVAIDTSGSIPRDALEQIDAELRSIVRLGLALVVVEFDVAVRRVRAFGRGDALGSVMGRGGTDLRIPFGRELLRTHRPDALVCFTDGRGPAPTRPPLGVSSVLWVVSTGGVAPAPWGRVVRM